VASGQVDCATDFDRNRTAMIESGKLERSATEIVWQSDPLPNDAIAVRKGFDAGLAKKIQETVVAINETEAKTILPNHYTGFVTASHDSYKMIEEAGILVGRIKKK
jgi:phosphonate transport system substrate-binding protein